MVSINYAIKEISCKIVFYGPGLSGKTTNLQYVHRKVPPNTKGELISLATDADRTLYFDFLPMNLGAIHGFTTKFQLYTVPGQVYYNATRKLVLRGVDGLVFVADSQKAKMSENIESLENLKENLSEYSYKLEEIPLLFQYNKRDLPNISSIEELELALNPGGVSYFEAVATQGIGVFDTLKCISKMVLEKASSKSEAPSKERMMADSFREEIKSEIKRMPEPELKPQAHPPVVPPPKIEREYSSIMAHNQREEEEINTVGQKSQAIKLDTVIGERKKEKKPEEFADPHRLSLDEEVIRVKKESEITQQVEPETVRQVKADLDRRPAMQESIKVKGKSVQDEPWVLKEKKGFFLWRWLWKIINK
jgi:signal recognition particle receptor subunit beta